MSDQLTIFELPVQDEPYEPIALPARDVLSRSAIAWYEAKAAFLLGKLVEISARRGTCCESLYPGQLRKCDPCVVRARHDTRWVAGMRDEVVRKLDGKKTDRHQEQQTIGKDGNSAS
jgi:hypothetical protein